MSDLEDDKEDVALLEEMEGFALKAIQYFNPNHPPFLSLFLVFES
jgi:hypothetical protein